MTARIPRWVSAALTSAALVVAVTAVIALLEPRAPALGLGVLYLLAVVPIALLYGAAVAGAASVASMAAFSFWTGLAFPESGDYVFPEGLATLHVDRDVDRAAHWERNVWMIHPDTAPASPDKPSPT